MQAHVRYQPFRAERPASSTGGMFPHLTKRLFSILYKEKEVLKSLRSSEAHNSTTWIKNMKA